MKVQVDHQREIKGESDKWRKSETYFDSTFTTSCTNNDEILCAKTLRPLREIKISTPVNTY